MIKNIRHVGLVVHNLEQSLSFWCDMLGFVVARRVDESGEHLDAMLGLKGVLVTTVKLTAPDGSMLELLHFHSHKDIKKSWNGKPYSIGFTHIAVTVENLDITYKTLSKAGVTFANTPQCAPDGSVKMIYASGPEGVLIEFVEVLL